MLEIKVNCLGETHKIGFTPKGKLVFFNHTNNELRAEEAFQKLGGKPCECYRVLESWRSGRNLPPELKEAWDRREMKRVRRYIKKRRKEEGAH